MTVVTMTRIRDGALKSADLATVTIYDSSGGLALTTTVVTPASEGAYAYSIDSLAPGNYTVEWGFQDTGFTTETVSRPFSLDTPSATVAGTTLMAIERAVARRVGPYRRVRAATGSTVNRAVVASLKSSLNLGEYEDQFLLRRGLTYDDQLVPGGILDDDRVRMVDTYDASNGYLQNDRAWTVAPISDEALELHYLDPEQELRACVKSGLARCFFWDDLVVTVASVSSAYSGINLTALFPWLRDTRSIRDTKLAFLNSRLLPSRLNDYRLSSAGGNLWIQSPLLYTGSLTLSVLRPVNTWVNGEDNLSGPDDDLDLLNVPLDYAAWAGVLECWKDFPDRLQPAATQELRASRKDAAAEFTRWSIKIWGTVPEFVGGMEYTSSDLVSAQIGNLPETP